MIGYIDIKVNAARPNFPLAPFFAFVGSPSNVRVINVPRTIGKWQITAVAVALTLPDNTTSTVSAVNVAGCWVATLPSSAVTGYCAKGLQVTASGIDENGAAVTGYCLGIGDVTILDRDASAVSDGVRYYLHYCDEQPSSPNLGDTCYIDGVLKWYNGYTWQPYAEVRYSIVTELADSGLRTAWTFSGDASAEAQYAVDIYEVSGTDWAATLYEDNIGISTVNFSSPSGTGRELLTADFIAGVRTIVATRQIVRALADRAASGVAVAAPGAGNTASVAFALPPAVPGKVRDLELDITFGESASSEGDISVSIFGADGAAPVVDFGADALADIAIGRNLVMCSELPSGHWLFAVRHVDFPST